MMHCSSEKPADPTIPAPAIATVPYFLGSSTLNELQKTQLYFSSPQGKNHTKQHISRTACYGKHLPSFLNCQQMSCTDLFPSGNNENSGKEHSGHKDTGTEAGKTSPNIPHRQCNAIWSPHDACTHCRCKQSDLGSGYAVPPACTWLTTEPFVVRRTPGACL